MIKKGEDPRANQFRKLIPGQQFEWSPGAAEVAEQFNLTKSNVEGVVIFPEGIELDPTMAERDWHTERRRRGDVVVVVTFPERSRPLIWGVYVLSRKNDGNDPKRGSKTGTTGKSQVPNSFRELKKRAVMAGLKVEPSHRGENIYDPDGNFMLSIAPDRGNSAAGGTSAVANSWTRLRKKALERGVDL